MAKPKASSPPHPAEKNWTGADALSGGRKGGGGPPAITKMYPNHVGMHTQPKTGKGAAAERGRGSAPEGG